MTMYLCTLGARRHCKYLFFRPLLAFACLDSGPMKGLGRFICGWHCPDVMNGRLLRMGSFRVMRILFLDCVAFIPAQK